MLLPEERASRACEAYARALVVDRAPRAVLGSDALAHVTLLHVETDEDPSGLWAEAVAGLPRSMRLDALALGLLRYDTPYHAPAADPATMAWLIVPCTEALRAAERRAAALPFVARSEVTTSNGDRFQPHVTLAIWEGEAPPSPVRLPEELFGPMEATLALGVIGPNGTYQRTLYSI